ncbi:MAG TPA: exodeoxyribonuclease VII small subunit [Candidatus Cloacimonadota bacterium]|nr:exodeoxyribonuclease VII small subunit [Candidatus Cloacimonadota bacterium]
MKSNGEKSLKFEEALRRLEEIVDQLEDGVDELDKIVDLFEEGTQMVEYCQKKLIQVETKIEVLSQKLSQEPKNGDKE